MINNKIHIAVIDDGINEKLCDVSLKYNVSISDELEIRQATGSIPYKNHGTICAQIIKKYLREKAYISSIKILNSQPKSNTDKLKKALDFCVEQNVDVANISLGSTAFWDRKPILQKVNEVYQKKLLMVCATSNKGYLTYPASFSNVIGVCCDATGTLQEGQIRFLQNPINHIILQASSNHSLCWPDGTEEDCGFFNSYAAPMITAQIANHLKEWRNEKGDLIEIIKARLLFQSQEKMDSYSLHQYIHPDWIQNYLLLRVGNVCRQTVSLLPLEWKCKETVCLSDTEELITFFQNDKENLFNIDGIFIESERALSVQTALKIKKNLQKDAVSVFYLDQHNCNLNAIAALPACKGWKPYGIRDYQKYDRERKEKALSIDVPAILFFTDEAKSLLQILSSLKEKFESEGYHCQIFSDEMIGLLSGVEYLSDDLLESNPSDVIEAVQSIVDIRKVDLCLFGVQQYTHNWKQLSENVDMTVNISFTPEFSATCLFDGQTQKIKHETDAGLIALMFESYRRKFS